jgi:hypothetical protein
MRAIDDVRLHITWPHARTPEFHDWPWRAEGSATGVFRKTRRLYGLCIRDVYGFEDAGKLPAVSVYTASGAAPP